MVKNWPAAGTDTTALFGGYPVGVTASEVETKPVAYLAPFGMACRTGLGLYPQLSGRLVLGHLVITRFNPFNADIN